MLANVVLRELDPLFVTVDSQTRLIFRCLRVAHRRCLSDFPQVFGNVSQGLQVVGIAQLVWVEHGLSVDVGVVDV